MARTSVGLPRLGFVQFVGTNVGAAERSVEVPQWSGFELAARILMEVRAGAVHIDVERQDVQQPAVDVGIKVDVVVGGRE